LAISIILVYMVSLLRIIVQHVFLMYMALRVFRV